MNKRHFILCYLRQHLERPRAGCVVLLISLMLFLGARQAAAQTAPASAPAANGQCYALIIAGHPGNALYARHYRDRVTRFYNYFTQKAHIKAPNIAILAGDINLQAPLVFSPATAKSIPATLGDWARKIKPEDQFILVILGHGATTEEQCTLIVPGPDLEMSTLTQALLALPAKNQVVLNFAANSGDSVTHLSRLGRVLITSTSPEQINNNDFAEFFLLALEKGSAPPSTATRPAQPLSVMQVYHEATLHYAQWTVRQKLSTDPQARGWMVEGQESAAIFKKLYTGPDVSPDRQFVPSPDSNKPDAPVDIVCRENKPWIGRRIIAETPALEDLGSGQAVTCLSTEGYKALPGSVSTEAGFLARQLILGQPQLLPVLPAKGQ